MPQGHEPKQRPHCGCLYPINLEAFEQVAHEIEYAPSCFIAAVDESMTLRLVKG